jgi:hypothetical protein
MLWRTYRLSDVRAANRFLSDGVRTPNFIDAHRTSSLRRGADRSSEGGATLRLMLETTKPLTLGVEVAAEGGTPSFTHVRAPAPKEVG